MKALEIKLVEKQVTVTYNFFRVQNEMEFVNTVVFENGYSERLDSVANELKFDSYKNEKAFKNTWSNKKRIEYINQNINSLPNQWLN